MEAPRVLIPSPRSLETAAAQNGVRGSFFFLGSGLGGGGGLDKPLRITPPAGALFPSVPGPQAPPAVATRGGGRGRPVDAATATKDGALTGEWGRAEARTPRLFPVRAPHQQSRR